VEYKKSTVKAAQTDHEKDQDKCSIPSGFCI